MRAVLVLIVGGVVVVGLAAARIAAPSMIRRAAVAALDAAPDYDAAVDDVDLSVLGGAVTLRRIRLVREGGAIDEPFVAIDAVRVRPLLAEAIRGSRVADVDIDGLSLTYRIGVTEADSQTGIDGAWLTALVERFPATVDHLTIHDGAFRYIDVAASPDVRLGVDELELVGSNLANRDRLDQALFASLALTGTTTGGGRLVGEIALDPYGDTPRFDASIRVTGIAVPALADAANAYARVVPTAGSLTITTTLRGEGGRFSGVATPVVSGLAVEPIAEAVHDREPALKVAWQAVVGVVE
ncbi:MAG: DUF748 domain-containing protein, partial [Myxococcota bacterium]